MTPQHEVLKHLGHANFDDNRSGEFSEAILPFSAVWDDIRMKYGFSLDQKKLHGSLLNCLSTENGNPNKCLLGVCWDCHFLPKELHGITPW